MWRIILEKLDYRAARLQGIELLNCMAVTLHSCSSMTCIHVHHKVSRKMQDRMREATKADRARRSAPLEGCHKIAITVVDDLGSSYTAFCPWLQGM